MNLTSPAASLAAARLRSPTHRWRAIDMSVPAYAGAIRSWLENRP